MMTKGTVAFWRIAGIVAKTTIPHINKPNPTSRFEGKYISSTPFAGRRMAKNLKGLSRIA
jgi:hypothetical protein